MISTKERVVTNLSDLNEAQLQKVAEYLEFLKFREVRKNVLELDGPALEALYAEFADEDRELAEAGMQDFDANLALEDTAK
jgi:hypothetical protein